MTAFDKVADGYWQHYVAGLPISGGMAYEEELRKCVLDESVDSLKELDKALILIKKDLENIIAQGTSQEELLRQTPLRNFLLFMGFYMGRVLSKHIGQISWLDYEVLATRYTLTGDKTFFLAMAAIPHANEFAPPFFALNGVGAKLFGSLTNKFFNPITGQPMSESLYWGLQTYLDELAQSTKMVPSVKQSASPAPQSIPNPPPKLSFTKSTVAALPINGYTAEPITTKAIATSQPSTPQQTPQALSRREREKLERQKNTYKAHFKEIKEDLNTTITANGVHNDKYQKAKAVIDKVFELTDGDEEKLAQLSDKQKTVLTQIVDVLGRLSEAGNTSAMLLLAICYFQGIGTPKNASVAVPFVQKAAEMGDIRACKFLSRIYYHGLGVNPSTQMGEIWLDKAAAGGHSEAKKLKNQFIQIQTMQNDYRVETEKDKRFMLMLVVVAVVFVAVIALSVKFL